MLHGDKQAEATRLSPPSLPPQGVIRHELIRRLSRVPSASILYLHAPAGCGKTTAAAAWLSATGKSAAWLTVDAYSSAPSEIYRGILDVLSCDTGALPSVSLTILLHQLATCRAWPSALVIDDFHLCADDAVAQALPLIRARLPQTTSFAVLSRTPPHASLGEHIMKGTVVPISNLSFVTREVMELFELSISEADAEDLRRQTDGWAAALSAVRMSGEYRPHCSLSVRAGIAQYLNGILYEFRDRLDALKKCSICTVVSPSLCRALTDSDAAWAALNTLAKKTGLLTPLGSQCYKFHRLLRAFLLAALRDDRHIHPPALYCAAARWHTKNGELLCALRMAAKSGDICETEAMARVLWSEFVTMNADLDAYVRCVEESLLSIPRHISSLHPYISLHCLCAARSCHPIAEVTAWLDVVRGHTERRRIRPSDSAFAAFLLMVDPRESQKPYGALGKLCEGTQETLPAFYLSQNLPYFHKALRDYTDLASRLSDLSADSELRMEPVSGFISTLLSRLVEAGVLYEMGVFDRAERIASELVQTANCYPTEFQFCAHALYGEVRRLQGKTVAIDRMADMISAAEAHHLLESFRAYETAIRLYAGDRAAAALWLAHHELPDCIRLYELAQYMTTALALLVAGRFADAQALSTQLAAYFRSFHRAADYVEVLTIDAICRRQIGGREKAVAAITEALRTAAPLHLVTPIAKYGGDVLPLLVTVRNRMRVGYDADILDRGFVHRVFLQTKTTAERIPGLRTDDTPTAITLSPRQREVLEYLAQNLSYREIGERLGIQITTVRDHITKLYEKLDVSSAIDALAKARELLL